MQQQPKQGDLLNTQLGADPIPNTKSDSQLMEYNKVPGSPFTIVRREKEWFLSMGNNRISEYYETEKEVLEFIEKDMFNLILTMIIILITDYPKLKKESEKTK